MINKVGLNKNEDYVNLLFAFWYQPQRDFKIMASNFAKYFDKFVKMENLKVYERMIRESAWWDISDNIIPNIIAKLLKENSEEMWKILD